MTVPLWAWAAFAAVILVMLAIDLLAHRDDHVISFRQAAWWSALWVGLSLVFAVVVTLTLGTDAGVDFTTAWLLEKSLSVDNLFVFVIIMGRFAVPAEYQQKTLLFGIAAALALRVVLIAIGAAAINLFSFTFLIFGLILIWTAVQLIRHRNEEPDVEDTFLVRRARTILPVSQSFHGGRMLAHEDGQRVMTPLLLVFVAIGSTDVLFALDSIPAVFGVTKDPFLVFAANAFALLGLRALYFLIEGLLERLVYLSIGLSVILAFIGAKLILQFLHEDVTTSVPEIPTPLSLGVILAILLFTTAASIIRVHAHPEERAKAGSLRKRREKRPREEEPARN